MFGGVLRSLHDGDVAARLLGRHGQRFAGMQVIGEIAVEGVGWHWRQCEALFMYEVAAFTRVDAELWQSLGGSQTLLDQIAGPAPRLHRLVTPVADDGSALTQDVPFGLESGCEV